MSTCQYPGCRYDDSSHRPYARLRDGVPSASTIAGTLDINEKARGFAWTAALIAATTAVHETPRWWNLPTHLKDGPCLHQAWVPDEEGKPRNGLCLSCRFIRSEFDRVWKAKMALGSHVHHLALSWAKGESVDSDETTEPYLDALERFYREQHPDFVHLERTIAHGAPYRGQFDFIAKTGPLGKCGLWDIKTGGFHPIEQTLQLAGYRFAHWLTVWEDKKEIRDRRMPVVDEAGVLMLHDDGTYELIRLPAETSAFYQFLDLLAAWRWAKGIEQWDKDRKKREGEK